MRVIDSTDWRSSLESHKSSQKDNSSSGTHSISATNIQTQSVWQTLLSFFGATFGISSLGLPVIMAEAGLGLFILTLLIALIVNYVSYKIILVYTEKYNLQTFPDFTEAVGGKKLRQVVNIFFFLSNVGTMLGAMIVFNSLMCLIFINLGAKNSSLTETKSLTWIILPSFLSLPLLLKQRLENFAWITLLSLAACLSLVFLLVVNWASFNSSDQLPTLQLEFFGWLFMAKAYSYIFYCFTCQLNIISVYRESGHKSFSSIRFIVQIYMAIFAAVYLIIGMSGYLAFSGRKDELIKKEIILGMFSLDNRVILAVNALMIFTAFNAYLYTFKPTKEILFEFFESSKEEQQALQEPQNIAQQDRPADIDLAAEQSQKFRHTILESDYGTKNIVATLTLLACVVTLSCIIVRKEIGFVELLNLVGDLITPILFVFIPLVIYFMDSKRIYLVGLLMFSGLIYLWRLLELGRNVVVPKQ